MSSSSASDVVRADSLTEVGTNIRGKHTAPPGYMAVPSGPSCRGCAFKGQGACSLDLALHESFPCGDTLREDHIDVIFLKLDDPVVTVKVLP